MFADDTILYIIVDNPSDSVDSLNDDLDRVTEWASQWIVKFSPSKTKAMLVSKNKSDVPPPIYMEGSIIEEVTSHKHLGVTLTRELTWREHIDNIVANASKSLDILSALKYRLDRTTLERLYFAFVRSKLEYAACVWDNCPDDLSEIVERVQYRAAKIVSGAIHRTSKELVYHELGWDSLKERRKNIRLKTMYKTLHGEAPRYLSETIPEQRARAYTLRNNTYVPSI